MFFFFFCFVIFVSFFVKKIILIEEQLELAMDKVYVLFGVEILKLIEVKKKTNKKSIHLMNRKKISKIRKKKKKRKYILFQLLLTKNNKSIFIFICYREEFQLKLMLD